jgi:hypothetical protein
MTEAGVGVPPTAPDATVTPFEHLLSSLRVKFDEQRIVEGDENALVYFKKKKPVIGIRVGQNGSVGIKSEKGEEVLASLDSIEQVDGILKRLL